jgi:Cu/Ag efflux protein CusF
MRHLTRCSIAAILTLTATAASAQVTKTLTGEMRTETATVEAIERSTREVTLKKSDGTYTVAHAPRDMKRFDTLKIGDTITAKYYDNIVLRLKAPGEKDVDTVGASTTKAAGGQAAGTMGAQRTITATITEIDQSVPSITFKGPNNWTYSSRVEDKQALAKVKVGDKVDITWTAALILSLESK